MYYVGQTLNFKKRFRVHQTSHSYIGRALRKYGVANFNIVLLENVPEEELDYWEIHYIKECNSVSPNGYNLTYGGKGHRAIDETKRKKSEALKGRKLTEEHRKKLSESHKGKDNHQLGRYHSEEAKKKMSDAHTGKKRTDTVWNKGLMGEGTSFYGKHHTEETRKKISEIGKGRVPWNKGKPFPHNRRKKLCV